MNPIITKEKTLKKVIHKKYINVISTIINKKETVLLTINIPKIKLNRNIYSFNNPNNNIENNIQILSSSDINKNTFILASHSGTNYNAYFNNLYKLNLKDSIYIKKDKSIYVYQITDIYYINKTGYLELETNLQNTLILITCSAKYKNKQLIIRSKLININNKK